MHADRRKSRIRNSGRNRFQTTLLDEGQYLCSVRTIYRIWLRVPIRSGLGTSPSYPAKWTYFYLSVILDIFSRHAVGWMVVSRESAAPAEKLVREICQKQGTVAGQLTVHADRGPSMASLAGGPVTGRLGSHQKAQPALQLHRRGLLRVLFQPSSTDTIPRIVVLVPSRTLGMFVNGSSPGTTPSWLTPQVVHYGQSATWFLPWQSHPVTAGWCPPNSTGAEPRTQHAWAISMKLSVSACGACSRNSVSPHEHEKQFSQVLPLRD